MNRTPKHHELPRYYLRGFSEGTTSFVWVFERGVAYRPGRKYGNNPRRLGLREAGLRADGYVAWHRDGRRHFRFETALQKQERVADDTIRRVREFEQIDRKHKEILARYIGLMWRRLGVGETLIGSILERHVQQTPFRETAWHFAAAGKFEDARKTLEEFDWLRSPPGQTEFLRETILNPFDKLHAVFMGLNWVFQRTSSDAHFVTCDMPVISNAELGVRRSPLLFPISDRVLLVATSSDEQDLAWRQVSHEECRALNRVVIASASRYVYASSPDEWIYQYLVQGRDA